MRLVVKCPLVASCFVFSFYFFNLLIVKPLKDSNNEIPDGLTDRDKLKNEQLKIGREIHRRADFLRIKCIDYGLNKERISDKLKNIIIDRSNNVTYCPIYKAASTSWTIIMLKMINKWNENVNDVAQLAADNFLFVKNHEAAKMAKGTKIFTVVRHPYERLVSCYRDKYENIKQPHYYSAYGEKMVRLFRENLTTYSELQVDAFAKDILAHIENPSSGLVGNPMSRPIGPTFEEFVRYILSPYPDDEHWKPFVEHCSMCNIPYDVILKFEHFQEESSYFLHNELKKKVELERKNAQSAGSNFCSYYRQLPPILMQSLEMKYHFDFIFFEYNIDILSKSCG